MLLFQMETINLTRSLMNHKQLLFITADCNKQREHCTLITFSSSFSFPYTSRPSSSSIYSSSVHLSFILSILYYIFYSCCMRSFYFFSWRGFRPSIFVGTSLVLLTVTYHFILILIP